MLKTQNTKRGHSELRVSAIPTLNLQSVVLAVCDALLTPRRVPDYTRRPARNVAGETARVAQHTRGCPHLQKARSLEMRRGVHHIFVAHDGGHTAHQQKKFER